MVKKTHISFSYTNRRLWFSQVLRRAWAHLIESVRSKRSISLRVTKRGPGGARPGGSPQQHPGPTSTPHMDYYWVSFSRLDNRKTNSSTSPLSLNAPWPSEKSSSYGNIGVGNLSRNLPALSLWLAIRWQEISMYLFTIHMQQQVYRTNQNLTYICSGQPKSFVPRVGRHYLDTCPRRLSYKVLPR